MPFSKTTDEHTEEYWIRHFEDYLKPLIEECPNIRANRSEALHGDILRQIITNLVVSPVVVADLTDANPNVYWELGVRQSFKNGTITIAEEGTKIPFDLSIKSVLFYSNNRLKDIEFRRRFKTAIMDCINHPEKPDSHVLETISGRGTLFEIFRKDETRRRVQALVSENEMNKGIMKEIYRTIDENKNKPEAKQTLTVRMQSCAIQLLVTSRYLDKDEDFYRYLVATLGEISKINTELDQWQRSPDPAERWFEKNKIVIQTRFNNYSAMLSSLYKEECASMMF